MTWGRFGGRTPRAPVGTVGARLALVRGRAPEQGYWQLRSPFRFRTGD